MVRGECVRRRAHHLILLDPWVGRSWPRRSAQSPTPTRGGRLEAIRAGQDRLAEHLGPGERPGTIRRVDASFWRQLQLALRADVQAEVDRALRVALLVQHGLPEKGEPRPARASLPTR
jgi:hypothetical protein